MGVTRALNLCVRLPQCPGVHRGCPAAMATASPGPPGLLPPPQPAAGVGGVPMPAGSGPGAPWGTGVAAVRGREGRGAGPRGAWQRRGVAWGPLAWRTALSFQAPGAGGRRFQARTGGGAGLLPRAASGLRTSRGWCLRFGWGRGGVCVSLAWLIRNSLRRLKRG